VPAGGTSGSPPAFATRCSWRQNQAASNGDMASEISVQAGQPRSRPSISGTTSAASAAAESATPPRSSSGLAPLTARGRRRSPAANATIATGRFTRKIRRQPKPPRSAETSAPPSNCPATAASPSTMPKMERARGRSRGGNSAWIDATACGAIAAAASACRMRPAISASGDQASPHSSEAAANPARPPRNTTLRPNRSPSRPPVMRNTA
jgi:hypothetical protein